MSMRTVVEAIRDQLEPESQQYVDLLVKVATETDAILKKASESGEGGEFGDPRLMAIARTHFQTGFLFALHAVINEV